MVDSSEELIQRYGSNTPIPIEAWKQFKEMPLPESNFIFKLANFMNERTKVMYDWCELNAMVALATVSGHTLLYTSYGSFRLNSMIFALGNSGCGKSAVQRIMRYIFQYLETNRQTEIKMLNNSRINQPPKEIVKNETLEEILECFVAPNNEIHEDVQEKPKKKKEEKPKQVKNIDKTFLGPRTFSKQGYIKLSAEVDEYNNNVNTEYCVIIFEYSTQTQDMKMEHKRADNQFICEMYDGDGIDDVIAGDRGHVKVNDIYWNMSVATTDSIFKSLTFQFLIDGLGNRCAFCVFKQKDIEDRLENESNDSFFMNDKIDDIINNNNGFNKFSDCELNTYGMRLLLAYDNVPKAMKFSPEAQKKYSLYKKSRSYDSANKYILKTLTEQDKDYINRQYFTLIKYAGLFCIGRNFENLPGRDGVLIVEEKDMDLAIRRIERNIDGYFDFVEAWVDAPENEKSFSNKPFVKEVIKCFDNAPHGIRCVGEIGALTNKDSDTRLWQRVGALTSRAPPILDEVETNDVLYRIAPTDPEFYEKHGINPNKMLPKFFRLHVKQP